MDPGMPCTALAAFEPYSLVHVLAVLLSLLGWWALLVWGRRIVRVHGPSGALRWRRAGAWLLWGVNAAWLVKACWPGNFTWQHSLPLQLCDLAWIAAGWSLWSAAPAAALRHQLPVLWGLALSTMAYLTPAVTAEPDSPDFWAFWILHWQILAVALLNLQVAGTRITEQGRMRTIGFTVLACALVTGINLLLDSSYFFTGRAKPANPSPVDWLGAWPLRIVWIVLLGVAALHLVGGLLMLRQRREPAGSAGR
ncbi:MAG: TIGR02206 family membrane protein [Planctomycetia bacterium]